MTVYEFIRNTHIFPDMALYFAACQVYEKKNADGSPAWDSIKQFCDAYKLNEHGLAETVQDIANQKLEAREQELACLKAENAALHEDVRALHAQISDLKQAAERRAV